MRHFIISLAIGLIAAIIDTLPMILKKLDTMFILSAFFFWILVGFLIPKANFSTIAWLNGIIVACIMLIPLLFLIFRMDKGALPQICISTVLLGATAGFFTKLFLS